MVKKEEEKKEEEVKEEEEKVEEVEEEEVEKAPKDMIIDHVVTLKHSAECPDGFRPVVADAKTAKAFEAAGVKKGDVFYYPTKENLDARPVSKEDDK